MWDLVRAVRSFQWFTEELLQNRFLLPRLFGRNVEGLGISPDSDELEMMRLDHIPDEYFDIWAERELLYSADTLHRDRTRART